MSKQSWIITKVAPPDLLFLGIGTQWGSEADAKTFETHEAATAFVVDHFEVRSNIFVARRAPISDEEQLNKLRDAYDTAVKNIADDEDRGGEPSYDAADLAFDAIVQHITTHVRAQLLVHSGGISITTETPPGAR